MKIPIQFVEDEPFEVFIVRHRFAPEHRVMPHKHNGDAKLLPAVRASAHVLATVRRTSLKRIWQKGSA